MASKEVHKPRGRPAAACVGIGYKKGGSVIDTGASQSEVIHAAAFPEWAEPPAHAPLRQGDVLAAVQEGGDPWRDLLVVITADCDLAKDKHEGALTCVPVLRLEHYLLQFRYGKQRDVLVDRLIRAAMAAMQSSRSATELPRVSETRMAQWLTEESVHDIVHALLGDAGDNPALEILRQARALMVKDPENLSEAVDSISTAKLLVGDFKTPDKARNAVASDFASSLNTLPGDVILLNEISAAHGEGYVGYLRRVIEVTDSKVVTSYSRMPHDASYVRIGRLRPPYVYALTQQFAAVFSAIGLPATYESARASIGERIKSGDFP